jgi:transketolase
MEKADENTYLLVGDVGYSVIEPFIEKFPKQYLNTGVMEQNMTGMAAGLALEGYKVLTYSIANFNTIRCLEQIRNDICSHNLDVTVVSVGGGFTYGAAGYSHHAIQDISMLGSLPNMTLLLPADGRETEFCMEYIFRHKSPKYLRIGKNGEKLFHQEGSVIKNINRFNPQDQANVALVSVGTILSASFEAGDLMKLAGTSAAIYSCPIIGTNFSKDIYEELKGFEYIVTIEEHVKDFGFGSIIKNAFEGKNNKIISFGAKRDLCELVGSQAFLRQKHGLDGQSIADGVKKFIKEWQS